jgi:hypothetical protein
MEEKARKLIQNWSKRNISGFFCPDKAAATDEIMALVPAGATVGVSGSQTLDSLGIVKKLTARGTLVFDPSLPSLSRQQSLEERNKGASADYYLASANALSEEGELVFFSAYGHRIAGIANAKNVIIVCGVNKISATLELALKRAREYTTPLNCKRLNWNTPCFKEGMCSEDICFFPEYKRMCCQVLIVEAEVMPQRLRVVLVGQELGF